MVSSSSASKWAAERWRAGAFMGVGGVSGGVRGRPGGGRLARGVPCGIQVHGAPPGSCGAPGTVEGRFGTFILRLSCNIP